MSDFERWDHQLQRPGGVRLRTRRSKNVWALFGCLAFTAVGLWAAADGSWLVAVLAIGFFGVIGIPSILLQMLRPRDVHVTPTELRIDRVVLPWDQVTGVELLTIANQSSVVLRLTDEGDRAVDAGLNPYVRRFQRANAKLLGGPVLALPAQLGGDRQEMAAWLAVVHGRATTPGPARTVRAEPEPEPQHPALDRNPGPDDHARFMPPGTQAP
jgi:hypothetical protein